MIHRYDSVYKESRKNSKVHDIMNAPSEFISIQLAFGAIFRTFFVFNVLFHKGVTGTFTVQP